ncbi:B12-binding domain-containing radical SAM protein, partial [Candidatus Omnitrophota bacterium]
KHDNYNEIEHLNEIPFSTFEGIDRTRYDVTSTLPILMSRGCIRQCSFCSERLLYKGFRIRSAEYVVQEIEFHMKHNKVTSFVFHDSLINGELRTLEQFCDQVFERGLSISWEAQCSIRNDMDVRILEKMKQAGCFNLFIGLESASNTVLQRMSKGMTRDDARTFFEKCNKVGLHFEISLITNFPGETEDEFHETCDFIREHKGIIPKIAQVNPYVPYAGTEIGDAYPVVDEAQGQERMQKLVILFEEEEIPYTKSYIGNLLPA